MEWKKKFKTYKNGDNKKIKNFKRKLNAIY